MKSKSLLQTFLAVSIATHVKVINASGVKVNSAISETGLRMFVIARTKPADVGLRKYLSDQGVDPEKAPQNAFQIARSCFLIGDDDKSQPTLENAARVTETAFLASSVRCRMAVSTCLNTLDKLLKDEHIAVGEIPGHESKLCGFIVKSDAQGAAEYLKTLRAIGKADSEAEPGELPDEISDADSLLQTLAAATLAFPKVEWTPENHQRAIALIGGLVTAADAATPKPAKVAKAA